MYLSTDLIICASSCLFSWLSHQQLIRLFLSPSFCHSASLTVHNYQSDHPSTSPSVYPPPYTPHLVSPSVCLSVRNERNLQQKQQLAGGPMSHDAVRGARRAPHTPHLAFYCVRSSTITFAFTDAHLICRDWHAVIAWTMTATDASILHSGFWGGRGAETEWRDWQTPLVLTC